MSNELIVAIQISDIGRSKSIKNSIDKLKGIKLLEWSNALAEKGPASVKRVPDILLIDETAENGNLIKRIQTIKSHFPQMVLFVVSENKDYQHIIDAMKAGASEFLVDPINEENLLNTIEDVRAKFANIGHLKAGKIYSFISAKGGVGSTVLAVNSAAALGMDKKTTVAISDMSFQSGDASVLLDILPENTISDIAKNLHRLDVAFLRGVMTTNKTGVDFLAAPVNPEDSEDIKGEHVSKTLNLMKKLYDHVVVDCGSMNINDSTLEALKQSDKVFVVTDMSVPSIRNTVRLCKLVRKLGIELKSIEILINRYIKGGTLSLEEIEKNFDKPAYWLVPNDFAGIVTSINRGIPLVKMSQGSAFSKNVVQFIQKLKGLSSDKNYRGIKGSFGKNI